MFTVNITEDDQVDPLMAVRIQNQEILGKLMANLAEALSCDLIAERPKSTGFVEAEQTI